VGGQPGSDVDSSSNSSIDNAGGSLFDALHSSPQQRAQPSARGASPGGGLVSMFAGSSAGGVGDRDGGDGGGNSSSGGGGGRCLLSAVVGWDDGRDYGAGLQPLPGVLVDEGCPPEVFAFLSLDQPWPPAC
jgi:hypothetical protein